MKKVIIHAVGKYKNGKFHRKTICGQSTKGMKPTRKRLTCRLCKLIVLRNKINRKIRQEYLYEMLEKKQKEVMAEIIKQEDRNFFFLAKKACTKKFRRRK